MRWSNSLFIKKEKGTNENSRNASSSICFPWSLWFSLYLVFWQSSNKGWSWFGEVGEWLGEESMKFAMPVDVDFDYAEKVRSGSQSAKLMSRNNLELPTFSYKTPVSLKKLKFRVHLQQKWPTSLDILQKLYIRYLSSFFIFQISVELLLFQSVENTVNWGKRAWE